MKLLLDIARESVRDVVQSPGLLLLLLAANLMAGAALWVLAGIALGPVLSGRPEPDLAGWMAIFESHVQQLRWLLLASGGVGLGYLLLNTLLAGAVLERLRSGAGLLRGALGHLSALLRLRLLAGLLLAAPITAWVFAAPELYERSLALDTDWLPAAIQGGLALLLCPPLLATLLLLHLGQARVALGAGPVRALRGALGLLRRRLGLCLGLYLLGWLAWAAVTAAVGSGQISSVALAQLAVLLRVAIHLWSYATALRIAEAD
jgi:hypothetical protein